MDIDKIELNSKIPDSVSYTFLKEKDSDYTNILPTLSLLDPKDEKILFNKLRALDFPTKKNVAA